MPAQCEQTVKVVPFNEAIRRIEGTISKEDTKSFEVLDWMKKTYHPKEKTLDQEKEINIAIGRAHYQAFANFEIFISTLVLLCEDNAFRKSVFTGEHDLIVDTSGLFEEESIVFFVDLESPKLTPVIRKIKNLKAKDLRLYRMVWLPQ